MKPMMYAIGIAMLLFAGGVSGINLYISKIAGHVIYEQGQTVPKAYAALILGAKVHSGGRLSHMLEDRVLTGLELYRDGTVQKLLLSGDHGQKDYDEVNAMRVYLLKHGVPEEDIFMDHAGFNTYASMYRARDVFQVQEVIVVTQKFHLARAVYIAQQLGLRAVGFVADRRVYMPASQTKAVLRETLARVKAFFDVHIWHAQPKYLGKVIPITGDGRDTVD